MLENITTALKAHYTTAQGAKTIWDNTRKEIEVNYIGNMKTEKLNAGKEVFESTIQQSKESTYNACAAALEAVKAKAEAVVAAPVAADFPATLEAVKAIESPSEAEVAALMDRFKNNYFSYRAICDFMDGESMGYKAVTVDEIEELIAVLGDGLKRAIFGSVDSYAYQNFMNGSIISSYDKVFNDFVAGRFDEVAEAVQDAGNAEE